MATESHVLWLLLPSCAVPLALSSASYLLVFISACAPVATFSVLVFV